MCRKTGASRARPATVILQWLLVEPQTILNGAERFRVIGCQLLNGVAKHLELKVRNWPVKS